METLNRQIYFFRANNSELEVGLIDFQWSGFGLAATDVAHHITAVIHADLLENGGEETLLRHYYDDLQKSLLEFGAYNSIKDFSKDFSYSEFVLSREEGLRVHEYNGESRNIRLYLVTFRVGLEWKYAV